MKSHQQLPNDRVSWQARPGERELRTSFCGVKYFDPIGSDPLRPGEKGARPHG